MTRPSPRVPSYRHYRPKNLAVVRIDGQDRYLGQYDSPKSWQKYHQLIAEWLAGDAVPLQDFSPDQATGLKIKKLVLLYDQHAEKYYVKNGRTTTEFIGIREAAKRLLRLYAETDVVDFGPKALKLVRDELIRDGHCRRGVNQNIGRIKRMFKWGVEQEIVPVTVFQALLAVVGLRKGRSSARESEPVRPVDDTLIDNTLPFLPRPVQAMVKLQRLTGCRPGEICLLRPRDVDRSQPVWCYVPASHKTMHHDHARRIYLGPQAQAILSPWLERDANGYCFSPAESRAEVDAARRRSRRTPMTPSQAGRRRKTNPKKRPGLHYTSSSYQHAISKACLRGKTEHWSPNQIRHTRATELRQLFGLEACQAVLGHRQAFVTQIYAERDFAAAARIMGEAG